MCNVARSIAVICLLLVFSSRLGAQGEASRYVLLPSAPQTLNATTDYFSVSLVQAWLSSKHGFLQTLLSTDTKFSVLLSASATFFDGQKVDATYTFSNSDIKKNVSKSWGINPRLVAKLPADIDPELRVQLAVYRDDNIGRVLGSLDASKAALPADILASPVLGYAQAVDGIFKAIFGTDRTRYPFLWEGSLGSSPVPRTPGGFKEHYVVLIAPRDANDQTYLQLDVAKLTYDEVAQRLKYNGQVVTDWSFAVFHVAKEAPYDIANLLNQSTAPWAVLATSVFRSIPTGDATSVEELRTLAKTLVDQLANEADLLKRELRFSAYSRGVALSSLATRARSQIAARCKVLGIDDLECPLDGLTQVAANATGSFGLADTTLTSITVTGATIGTQLFTP